MKLYTSRLSGNSFKVRLLMALLGKRPEEIEIDIFGTREKHPGFATRTPEAKVPAIETEDGWVLAESGAILFHLARGSPYLPDDPRLQAQVLQWMFFEQNQLECTISVIRAHRLYGDETHYEDAKKALFAKGERSLRTLERHLADRTFLVGDRLTIADIMLYPYTRTAEDAGYRLGSYPAVQRWLGRVETWPGSFPFTPEPTPTTYFRGLWGS